MPMTVPFLRRPLLAAGLCGLFCLCLLPAAAAAKPVQILLYPDGALVQEEARLTVQQDGTARLPLPAVPWKDLSLTVEGGQVDSIRVAEGTDKRPGAAAALEARLKHTLRTAQEREAQLKDLDARLAQWRDLPLRNDKSTPQQLTALDALAVRQLDSLRPQRLALLDELTTLREQAARLEVLLKNAGGGAAYANTAILKLAAGSKAQITVRYAWHLEQRAGWKLAYRLNAHPRQQTVQFELHADIFQQSGEDWDNVPLTLYTQRPGRVSPPAVSSWLIGPAPLARAKAAGNTAAAYMAAPDSASAPENILPRETSNALSWEVGRRTLRSGEELRLVLSQETLKAAFTRVLRPFRGDDAYLSALLDVQGLRHFPAGTATLLVDGVRTGTMPLALRHDTTRVFFGPDPLVSARMELNTRQSGESGLIINKKQTNVWDWTITVFNKHSWPVTVRVEDAEPQARDERIALSSVSEPKPVLEKHTLVWTLDIPAGGSASIRHTVRASAPDDLRVNPGR